MSRHISKHAPRKSDSRKPRFLFIQASQVIAPPTLPTLDVSGQGLRNKLRELVPLARLAASALRNQTGKQGSKSYSQILGKQAANEAIHNLHRSMVRDFYRDHAPTDSIQFCQLTTAQNAALSRLWIIVCQLETWATKLRAPLSSVVIQHFAHAVDLLCEASPSPLTTAGDAAAENIRIHFDPQTQTITLDGEPFSIENPRAFKLYKAIVDCNGEPITRAKLRQPPHLFKGDKIARKLLDMLPSALRKTVLSDNNGYCWRLPVSKKIRA